MQNGNWVPVSKYFADSLPRDRKFTELEAIYSLQLDYNNDNSVTVSGCASRWGWSRSKVRKFLLDNEVVITYDSDTKSTKNQRGVIDVHPDKKRHIKEHKEDIKETLKGHKRFIDSKWIAERKDIKETLKGHEKDNGKSTTNKPINNPNLNKELLHSIVDYLNDKLGTKFKHSSDKTVKCINARINEKYTLDDFKTVIDKKYNSWFGTEDAKYLRPETLFGNKFDGYLNELSKSGKTTPEKLSFEKYVEAFKYRKEKNIKGEFKFKEIALNKIVSIYNNIDSYDFNSPNFKATYDKYTTL